MASSPQLSGQSIVPRKRSQSGWRSCSGEFAVFFVFFIFIAFLMFFLEGSFLFRVCTKIKKNVKCPYTRLFTSSHQQRFSSTYWQVYPFLTLLNQGHASECYQIKHFFLQENRFIVQPLSVPRNVCALDPCSMFSSRSIQS